ncbi:ABC transporter permease [Natronoglycomyces albus]|uniref:ABC transporter permease n=2 Tax=Natronoglycomyces albus TaxID=2811108 RepID=A0A895XNL6_9ACTN|nr:ABC transporter permease [Natronoglycomyces albus]
MRGNLIDATNETLYMVGMASLWTLLGGVALGVLLYVTSPSGLKPLRVVNWPVGIIVNLGRSAPFIILMVAILPFTRALVGTTIGTTAAIVPLAVAAIPFYARLVEAALLEVQPGLTEASRAMGATVGATVWRVVLPEATPGLIRGFTVTVVAITSYSAMAGAIGGGGLGNLAYTYGYLRYQTEYMIATIAILIILVQLFQALGDRSSRVLDRR